MGRSAKAEYAMGAICLLSNRLAHFGEGQLGDVTFRQWFLLTMLSKMGEGPWNVRELAEFVGTSRQNVRKMIDPLERRGYLELTRSEADARSLDVRLTRKAHRFLAEADAPLAEETDRLFAGLTDDDMDALVRVLRLAMASVDAYDEA